MKIILFVFLLVVALFAADVSAQQASGAPDLTVLRSRRYLAIPDQRIGNDAVSAQNQARLDRIDPERDRTRVPSSSELKPSAGIFFRTYVYELKVRNDGRRTVQKIIWEYVLADSITGKELNRILLVDDEIIAPGKNKNLTARRSVPLENDRANNKDKSERGKNAENAVIRRVEYTDGSVWRANP